MFKTGLRLIEDIEKSFKGSRALIVGGAVRDQLLGKPIHDVDVATNVDIDLIAEKYESVDIGKSKEFGIVLVEFEGKHFEVAQFRQEFGTENNRHPSEVKKVETFQEDASRRDITINAMGINSSRKIVDHFGGRSDLEKGIVKAVGNAELRFEEDALRILRVARFAAKYDFEIEYHTKNAMLQKGQLVLELSRERIQGEMEKVAVSGKALAQFIDTLQYIGVLGLFLPEIATMINYGHTIETHPEGGVYDHTLAALRKSRVNDVTTNLAILFHDVGKINTQEYDENGRVSYKRHESVGANMIDNIGKRLKFSNDSIESFRFATKEHMIFHLLDVVKKSRLVALRQNKNYEVLKEVAYADAASRMHLFDEQEFNDSVARVEAIHKEFGEKAKFEERMSGLINGKMIIDLAKDFGVEIDGPKIGKIKRIVRERIIELNWDITLRETIEMVYGLLKGN